MGRIRRNTKGVAVAILLLGLAVFTATVAAGALKWSRLGRLQETTGAQPLVAALAAHPSDPDILYAGAWLTTPGAALVYRSADGGATWQRFSNGLSVTAVVTTLGFAPARPDVALGGTAASGVWAAAEEVTDPPDPPDPTRLMFVPMIRR